MTNVFLPRRWLGLLIACGMLAGCASQHSAKSEPEPTPVQRLGSFLTGSYNTTAQSLADAEYFDIRLQIIPIWTARTDGPWLYVEQARADLLDQPYRQRVYRLSQLADGKLKSDVYDIPEPLRIAGAAKDRSKLQGLKKEELILKDGCAVIMNWDPATGVFTGGTVGNGCSSSLRGAAYATSEVTLSSTLLASWDRGYNAAGEQVWGAKKGGYRFVKETPAALGR